MEQQLEEATEEIPPNVQEVFHADTHKDVSGGDYGTSKEDELTPRLGMVFESIEEAHRFYNKYAYCVGFGTMIRSTKYKEDGQVEFTILTCSKQGTSRSKTGVQSFRLREVTKTNCQARVIIRHQPDGLFILHHVVLEHNHPVSPSMSRLYKGPTPLGKRDKKHLEINEEAGPPSSKFFHQPVQEGWYKNVRHREKICRNYIKGSKYREGDVEAIQEYLTRMRDQDSNFFHIMDLDEEGQLRNVFWADARSRAAYRYFGDVISLDTTYLKNKYDVPFAPIFGVNHHGHLVLLGCCLLANENIETYIWLFKALLSCMSGRPPNAIITDQCRAIDGAVTHVLPRSRHRLCLKQIMKKVSEKLGEEKLYQEIKDTFSKIVYNCFSYSDFEEGWRKMIEKYELKNNRWLNSLYEDRQRWVPVFVKDTFWAGMLTNEHSASLVNFFDDYVTSKSSIEQFIQQYESALKSKYEKEAREDSLSFRTNIQLISSLKMEEQVSKVYTLNIFKMFQDELKLLIQISSSLDWTEGAISLYIVKEYVKEKHMEFQVLYNADGLEVRCICCAYDFRGILCRHALSVLISRGVTEIPSKYIIDRWRKDFIYLHANAWTSLNNAVPKCQMERYHNLYRLCLQLIADIVQIGTISNERYESALKVMREAKEKLLAFNSSCGKRQLDQNSLLIQEGTENDVSVTPTTSNVLDDVPFYGFDPVSKHLRRRRATKRKQSQFEITMNKLKKKISQSKQVGNESDDPMQLGTCVGNETLSENHVSLQSKCRPLPKENGFIAENVSDIGSRTPHLGTHIGKQQNMNTTALNKSDMLASDLSTLCSGTHVGTQERSNITEHSSTSDLSVSTDLQVQINNSNATKYPRNQLIIQILGNI